MQCRRDYFDLEPTLMRHCPQSYVFKINLYRYGSKRCSDVTETPSLYHCRIKQVFNLAETPISPKSMYVQEGDKHNCVYRLRQLNTSMCYLWETPSDQYVRGFSSVGMSRHNPVSKPSTNSLTTSVLTMRPSRSVPPSYYLPGHMCYISYQASMFRPIYLG